MAGGTTVPIDKIQIADLVLATDPQTGETAAEEVTDLILGSGLKNLVRVGTDPHGHGKTDWITATDGHPFWVPGRGWTDADDLKVGDMLLSDRRHPTAVTELMKSVRSAAVHNLTVKRIHTYYVVIGGQPALVHNASSCPKHGHAQQRRAQVGLARAETRRGQHAIGANRRKVTTRIKGRQCVTKVSLIASDDLNERDGCLHGMGDSSVTNAIGEVPVPIDEALPEMRIVSLPTNQSWVGALILVKTRDNADGELGWSVRRTDGLSDEELLGMVSIQVEMLNEKIRHERSRE